MLTLLVSLAHAGPHCGTPDLLHLRGPLPARELPPPSAERTARDAFGDFETHTSEHFAVKVGPDDTHTDEQLEALLAGLEVAWDAGVEELGFEPPYGSEAWLVNVYVGNTGGGIPEIPFDGGYVTADVDGFPYIVLSPAAVDAYPDDGDEIDALVAHEFHHVLQFSTDAFLTGIGFWYFEASAHWFAGEMYPDSGYILWSEATYLLFPHEPLELHGWQHEGLVAGHQYAAGIWPRFLSEQLADEVLVVDSWRQSGPEDEPMEVFDALLEERGSSLSEAFEAFAVANVTLEHERWQVYGEIAAQYPEWFPEEDGRVVHRLDGAGDEAWQAPPAELRPHAFGYNVVELAAPRDGDLHVEVLVDPTGDAGTDSGAFAVLLVEEAGWTEHRVELDEVGSGSLVVPLEGAESAWLVVGTRPDTWVWEERFDHRFRLFVTEPVLADAVAPTEVAEPGGCSSTPSPPAWFLALGALALAARRPRPRRARPRLGRPHGE